VAGRFFKYAPDSDRYEAFNLAKVDINYSYQFDGCQPLRATWPIPDVKVVANRGKRADFPGWYDSMPVFSERAWQLLEPIVGASVEALPIRVYGSEGYYVINVLDTIDCIDLERSEHSYNELAGVTTWLRTRVAKAGVVIDKHMFKNRDTPHLEVYVSFEFKRRVQQHKLKGLLFKEVTRPSPGATS
jgi:uncharacterized protein DUF1629